MEKEEQKAAWKNKARPAIYTMAGIYLLIMDYYIVKSIFESSGTELLIMGIAAVLFTVCGAGMSIWGIAAVCKKEKRSEEQ